MNSQSGGKIMYSNRSWMLVGLLAVLLAAMPVWAAVYTVGGDSGKTIASGLAQLQPGDTLSILPGTYHEAITAPCDNVTIEGAGPGVILEGSVTLAAADFTPAADRPGVFYWQEPAYAATRIPWIFVDGQPLVFSKNPLDAAKQAWSFYLDQHTRRLEVVFDGKSVPNALIQVPTIGTLVNAGRNRQVTIRGLEVYRSVGVGISTGLDGRAEDNLVDWAGSFGIAVGTHAMIARNTTRFSCGPGIIMGGDQATVEENLVVANGCQWTDAYMNFCSTSIKANARSFCTFQQNWIVDRPKGGLVKIDGQVAKTDGKPEVRRWNTITGLWPDTACFNNNYIGNCIARLSHAGIYIELSCNRNVIMANDVQDCAMGITMRESSQNLVTRNWVWDRDCLGWGTVNREGFAGLGPGYTEDGTPITKLYPYDNADEDAANNRIVSALGSAMWGHQLQDGLSLWQTFNPTSTWIDPATHDNVFSQNLVQVNGVAVSVPTSTYPWPSAKERRQPKRPTTLTNQLTDNFYTRPAQPSDFALLGRSVVKTFAAYRKLTGWDGNAQLGNFTPAVLGLEPIWTIPAYATDTTTPVSILHDPSLEAVDTMTDGAPLFWHGSRRRGGGAYYDHDAKFAHSGHCSLGLGNGMNAQDAATWTSAAIPVKPGITMGVNLWMAAEKLTPATAGIGAGVTLHYTDVTGHFVGDTHVVGNGTHPELVAGTYAYTNVDGQGVVPAGACWMTVVLSAAPSSGTLHVDDIHIGMRNPVPPSFAAGK
jgi:hypothetical protein